eukprot:m.202944 g.202944  ORF g.202944 m.202944 type:complete len:465 (-) comp14982_c0_seq2:108-1502(-)
MAQEPVYSSLMAETRSTPAPPLPPKGTTSPSMGRAPMPAPGQGRRRDGIPAGESKYSSLQLSQSPTQQGPSIPPPRNMSMSDMMRHQMASLGIQQSASTSTSTPAQSRLTQGGGDDQYSSLGAAMNGPTSQDYASLSGGQVHSQQYAALSRGPVQVTGAQSMDTQPVYEDLQNPSTTMFERHGSVYSTTAHLMQSQDQEELGGAMYDNDVVYNNSDLFGSDVAPGSTSRPPLPPRPLRAAVSSDLDRRAELAAKLEQPVVQLFSKDVKGIPNAREMINSALSRKGTCCKTLWLSACGIGDVGAEPLTYALKNNQVIRKLGLPANFLSDVAVTLIAKILPTTGLQYLELLHNTFGEPGVLALMDAATKTPSIRQIGMARCTLTTKACRAVAAALCGRGQHIEVIDISDCGFNDNMMGIFHTYFISTNPNTITLTIKIGGHKLSGRGMAQATELMQRHSNLIWQYA